MDLITENMLQVNDDVLRNGARKIEYVINDNGCFECTSHKPNKDGYRHIVIKKKTMIMHRYIYEKLFGKIPEGMVIRHKCDNTHCINPEHLEIGTQADNVRDKIERGRCKNVKGESHGHAKLTAIQAYEIHKRANSGENLGKIARYYGVEKSTVFKIKQGVTWKHLTPTFSVLADVEKERYRQLELWGVQNRSFSEWLAILVEEVGEVAQAIQQGSVASKDTDADDLYTELIHVAAVASAIAEQVKEEKG